MTQPENRKPRRLWRFVKILSILVILFLVAGIPAVAFGLPALARTKWAKARLEKALARVLGTDVKIGKVEASWKRGLSLHDVAGQPANYGATEVAVVVREIQVKPEYGKLLRGKARAQMVLVAPDVRVRERTEPGTPANPCLPRLCRKEIRIDGLQVREGVLTLRSDRFAEAVRMEGIELAAVVAASRGRLDIEMSKLEARLNGGSVTGQGMFAITSGEAKSRVEVKGTGVESNDLAARALRYALPLFEALPSGSVRGRVDLRIKVDGTGKDVRAMLRSAQGEGGFLVRNAELRGCRILAAAGGASGLAEAAFHDAEGLFTVHDGKVHVLEARARGAGEVRLNGWVDLDGTLDYAVEIAGAGPAIRVTGTLAEPRAESGKPGEPH